MVWVQPRKKKYAYDVRDAQGNPIGVGPSGSMGTGMGGIGAGMPIGAPTEPVISPELRSLLDQYESQSLDIGRGGAGVTTYGWKMYEDEDKMLARDKDWTKLLMRILEGLRDAAKNDPDAVAEALRSHPELSSALAGATSDSGAGISGASGPGGGGGGGGGGV